MAPDATANASLDAASVDLAKATALQTVVLSPHMHLITDPNQAPSPESLAAFAKSMGLDESAIQNLLGQTPATAATALTAGLPPTIHALQAAIGSAVNPSTADGAANPDSAVATQLAAMAATAQTPAAASGAGLAAAATTLLAPALPGLTPTDMAAIQQLQITVLPAAVLPVNTAAHTAANAPMPSTLDMLSLLGTGVDEQDVSALLSRFSEESRSDSNSEQQQGSSNEGDDFSSFAQSLSRHHNAAQAATANAAPTAANMGEVYDQLSDICTASLQFGRRGNSTGNEGRQTRRRLPCRQPADPRLVAKQQPALA